jgi:hypothetical protein
MTSCLMGEAGEDRAAGLARLRAAMEAGPLPPAVPEPGCCGECARLYRMTAQHFRYDGACPNGHRTPKTDDGTEEGTG